MLNNFKISMGKNLSQLFINEQEYGLELFKLWREMVSKNLNIDIKPIHISDDENLDDNIVQLIDMRLEYLNQDGVITELVFNNDSDDDIELFLLKLAYLYDEIYKQECKLND